MFPVGTAPLTVTPTLSYLWAGAFAKAWADAVAGRWWELLEGMASARAGSSAIDTKKLVYSFALR